MKKVDLDRWRKYFDLRNEGVGTEDAARRAKISPSSAYRFERGDQGSSGLDAAAILGYTMVGGELVTAPLSEDAKRALEDFAFFRMRFMGRRSTPAQVKAAYEVLRAIEEGRRTGERQFIVINLPPGSGKSTLFTHDVAVWLICRDRTVRIQIGSRTERQARMYVNRIKKTLEREAPMRANAEDLAAGKAFDAIACVQDDYTSFKPPNRTELWRAEALTVRQLDGVALDDKEATVTAWGQDSGFLGGRFDVVLWDDLVDRKNTKTEEARSILREWFTTEAETRVEPGGVFILQGQRIGPNDLYRFALDMVRLDETRKYRHVIFKAHYDEICRKDHDDPAVVQQPWPEGCLIDPYRLPWRFLQTIKHNSPRTYAIQYQQEEGTGEESLIRQEWLDGGTDEDGYIAPGCFDRERSIGTVPEHLPQRGFSFVSVDPSPDNWWGVIWWGYDPASENRYVLDICRRKMSNQDFITMDMDTGEFSGLMEDWRVRSNTLGFPISLFIVEFNGAQKWLLNQPHVQKWQGATYIDIVAHTTHLNKNDPKYGLESIADAFRQGKIRLPAADPTSRLRVSDLTREGLQYPDGETTDLLMSTWFGQLAIQNHYTPRREFRPRFDRPGYMRGAQRGMNFRRSA